MELILPKHLLALAKFNLSRNGAALHVEAEFLIKLALHDRRGVLHQDDVHRQELRRLDCVGSKDLGDK